MAEARKRDRERQSEIRSYMVYEFFLGFGASENAFSLSCVHPQRGICRKADQKDKDKTNIDFCNYYLLE